MKKQIGYIPEEIVYISGKNTKLEDIWDDIESKKRSDREVTPAFVSDANNPKTIATGVTWAEGGTYPRKVANPKKETFKNVPTEGFMIVGLERRSEGGRAYKVVTPTGYYVDLREDVLLDTMLEVGIGKGGMLNGSFVWAKFGSQMKLIGLVQNSIPS